MNIYLIRHGRQDSSLCNVNVPLSNEGMEQARLLGERLRTYNIDAIYSSNLIRAKETAIIIQQVLEEKDKVELPYKIYEGLREINYGDLEGIENEEVKIKYQDFFEERDKLEEDLAFPGGENGRMVYERANKALYEIEKEGFENVVIVTHGGTIRSLLTGVLGMDQSKKLLFGSSLENCSISHLIYDKKKKRHCVERFNDYAHLESHPHLLRKNW